MKDMIKNNRIWLMLALMTLAACNSDETENSPESGQSEIRLQFVHPGAVTRATDTAFESSDRIGVYVTTAGETLEIGGNEVNNALFTYESNSWTASKKTYWNKGSHDVYAYYPYSSTVNDIEEYSFEVQADQSTAEGYTKSDFLWAGVKSVAASNTAVTMTFAHKMSNVIVKLEKGENYTGEIPSSTEVYIHSTVTKASVDLSTGDAAKDNYASSSSIRCRQITSTEYKACVVPQNITSRRPLVEVVCGEVSYLLEGKISLKQGYRHTITVTLDKNVEQTKIDIGGSITGW